MENLVMCPYGENLIVMCPYGENLIAMCPCKKERCPYTTLVHTSLVFYDGMVTGVWYGHIGVHKLCLCTPTRFLH